MKPKFSTITSTSSPMLAFTTSSGLAEFRNKEIIASEMPLMIGQKTNPSRSKKEQNAEIRERFSNGETLAAIGKDYGLTRDWINQICKGVERKVTPKRGNKPANE